MQKQIFFFLILAASAAACSRIPLREEVDFRNQLENAIVKTFPSKVVVYLHDFTNKTPNDKDNTYLDQAIPDAVEAVMEGVRDSLSYKDFEGMPFYVSLEISNLMQRLASTNTNTNTTEIIKTNNFFSYITNYLILTQELITRTEYDITTNTNYYEVVTNSYYSSGSSLTNYVSNQILLTTTNGSNDIVTAEDRFILTATNMLLLIHEEFPYLTNYLSYLPIEIVRAGEDDSLRLEDYLDPKGAAARRKKREAEKKPAAESSAEAAAELLIRGLQQRVRRGEAGAAQELRRQRALLAEAQAKKAADAAEEKTNTNNTAATNIKEPPKDPDPFIYEYHVYGSFSTARASRVDPLSVNLELFLSPAYSSGNTWWADTFKSAPPKLNEVLTLVQSLDTNAPDAFLDLSLRTPYERPVMTRRLADEIAAVSTNVYLDRPEMPETPLEERKRPILLRRTVTEEKISALIQEWQKYLVAEIVNRPYTVLTANSTPPKALVYMDGIYIGRTPLVYPTAPLGKHRFSFLQEGYERAELFSEVVGGQTNHLEFTLVSMNNSGIIKVSSSMSNSEVYLNAVFRGIAPITVSNLSLGQRYRVEVLNPEFAIKTNRNSAYKQILLTESAPEAAFNAKFKSYETTYRTPGQKVLLAATYLSWFTTIGLMGGTIYTYARVLEYRNLAGLSTGALQASYTGRADSFATTSQILLYSSLGGIFLSSGIMGWYLYSKEVYLGFSTPNPNQWVANLRIRF